MQDEIETILNVRGIEFEREKVRFPYASKSYQPDFTLDRFDAALEVKFCNAPMRERQLVDEINADILAYKRKYAHSVFVVYDQGCIRDVQRFRRAFEEESNVQVIVVKE